MSGLQVCAGFDGSENDDLTVIRMETADGHMFTPGYGPDDKPTIWNPADWPGHRIPRDQIEVAWEELNRHYSIERAYCDPGFHDEMSWETEIERWAQRYGEERFIPWPTNQIGRMHPALARFEADLRNHALTHDGCPVTATHMGNARKIGKPGDRYVLAKPSRQQKIDAAVTTVMAHEAAADARATGWPNRPAKPTGQSHVMYGFN